MNSTSDSPHRYSSPTKLPVDMDFRTGLAQNSQESQFSREHSPLNQADTYSTSELHYRPNSVGEISDIPDWSPSRLRSQQASDEGVNHSERLQTTRSPSPVPQALGDRLSGLSVTSATSPKRVSEPYPGYQRSGRSSPIPAFSPRSPLSGETPDIDTGSYYQGEDEFSPQLQQSTASIVHGTKQSPPRVQPGPQMHAEMVESEFMASLAAQHIETPSLSGPGSPGSLNFGSKNPAGGTLFQSNSPTRGSTNASLPVSPVNNMRPITSPEYRGDVNGDRSRMSSTRQPVTSRAYSRSDSESPSVLYSSAYSKLSSDSPDIVSSASRAQPSSVPVAQPNHPTSSPGYEDNPSAESVSKISSNGYEIRRPLAGTLTAPRVASPEGSLPSSADGYSPVSSLNSVPNLQPDQGPVFFPPAAASGSGSGQSSRRGSPRHSPQLLPQMIRRQSHTPSLTSDRRLSYYDLSGTHLQPHVGEQASLMPRIKTIDLYRRNAKRANDPAVEFQLAQYMVQTALLNSGTASSDFSLSSSGLSSTEGSKSDLKSALSSPNGPEDEVKLRHSLLKEAMASLRRLAERGHADSQYLLGDIYSTTAVSSKPDLEKSIKYFLMAAKHGHAEAAYRAALALQEGWGTSRDAARALSLYKTAAVKNQPGALYQLGMAYFHSRMGIPDNSSTRQAGIKWLSRAANVATDIYNRAPYELGKIYEVGYKDIVIPDPVYAVKLFARSAELGHVTAASRLGRAYEFGKLGCPQDPSLSIHYYTIAALGNDPLAQMSLAAWYMVGTGPHFPRNEDEAYEWMLRAALNGLPKAMYGTGWFLENGIGIERDLLEADKWFRRAADAGWEPAKDKMATSKAGRNSSGEAATTGKSGKCIIT